MARKHSLPTPVIKSAPRSEEVDLTSIQAPEVPQVIPAKKSWKVLKEQMVIIQGGTTYVAVGKIVRDPQIAQKLLDQGVEMELVAE